MRDHLLLYLNGKPLRVGGDEAFLTAAEFVRRRLRLTGTKIVCAEGDCGACAVLVGRPSADGRAMRYSAVNSCIQMMFQLDGAHLITLEGLSDGQSLNPIQESMVKCQGTQCGFCTPGFVVSLHDLFQKSKSEKIDAHAVRRGLVGNLCRCTGYDSIIKAALSVDRSAIQSIDTLYPPTDMISALSAAAGQEVLIKNARLCVYKPTSLPAACKFLSENAGATIVSGATDIGVQRNKGTRQMRHVLSTAGLRSMQRIEISSDSILVGAGATLSELEQATVEALPEMSKYLAWFGSPLIKNGGTLAGNLANASPIGDMIPPLMVLDAELDLAGPSGTRLVKINEFYTGYRATVLRSGELISRIRILLPDAEDIFKLYKVSRRLDLDISSFNAAIWMRKNGRYIQEIRMAFGGVGPVVKRLHRVERFLIGKPLSLANFEQAAQMARQEVTPISDVRGSDEYRRTLSHNILLKFWNELDDQRQPPPSPSPLRAGASEPKASVLGEGIRGGLS